MNDEVRRKMERVRLEIPKAKKAASDFERLLTLAKSAPFAGANLDFLERQEAMLSNQKAQNDLMETILEAFAEGEPNV